MHRATGPVYAHHKLDHEFERTQTTLSYAVCALPRSGSSLLCELLFDTGLAGAPAEYFDAQQLLESAFSSLRYVYISRSDRLRQAIAWARAVQTSCTPDAEPCLTRAP